MSYRKEALVDGEYYHVYNRGNSKQNIFLDKADYEHFVKCLFVCNTHRNFNFRDNIVSPNIDSFDFDRGETLVSIGAWVLMPNHFHIYLTINPNRSHKSDNWKKNNISEFMRKLSTAYSKYFNAKYNRTGGLFEGTFKSVMMSQDTQSKYIFAYIHLNPVKIIDHNWRTKGIDKKKAVDFLNTYKWGSYLDYASEEERKESTILQKSDFPKYFLDIKDFNDEIFDWLSFPPYV
ncbi:transposase [Candidatus Nomurabacteria bacterium]|nr:transposase [Candidatus Nomurabacteria bacterium]